MRVLTLIIAAGLMSGVATLAEAQTIAPSDQAKLTSTKTPQAADATDSIPDWYQRFSSTEGSEGLPEWVASSEHDMQLSLIQNRRWNVQLAMKSREGEIGLPREEMWAGASFNITSRLSIGGAVSVGAEDLGPTAEWGAQEVQTGIRLQSAFKF